MLKYAFAVSSVLLLSTLMQAQNTLFVNPQATGLNNGSSWQDAFTDLHYALNTAQAGSAVWVIEGTYFSNSGTNRDVYWELKNGTQLFGGFSGSETTLDQRDWENHPTFFDGDIGVSGDSTDNSYNLLYMEYPDTNTVVDGITFKNANANKGGIFNSSLGVSGGAIFINGIDSIAYPAIRNCRFLHNHAAVSGGAIYITGGLNGSIASSLVNCYFESNSSSGSGGAVSKAGASFIERNNDFKDCIFKGNTAMSTGGAVTFSERARNDTMTFSSCIFENNYAIQFGGAFFTSGRINGSNIIFENSEFFKNKARIGGALCHYSDDNPIRYIKIDDCKFDSNIAFTTVPQAPSYAPAFEIYSGYFDSIVGLIRVTNCSFRNQDSLKTDEIVGFLKKIEIFNSVFDHIGQIDLYSSDSLLFHNNVYAHNFYDLSLSANSNARKLLIFNNLFYKNKSISNTSSTILLKHSPAVMSGNLFVNNIFTIFPNFPSNPTIPSLIENNIFINNRNSNLQVQNQFIPFRNDSAYFFNNLVDFADCSNLPPLFKCLSGNIFNADPLFVDTAAGNFSLLPCSPAINKGINDFYSQNYITTDFAGNSRIQDGIVDIGPFESPSLTATSQVQPTCPDASNGAILFQIQNGCEPYSFGWTGTQGMGSDTFDLAAGQYLFTITDQIGKQIIQSVIVEPAEAVTIDSLVTQATCQSCADGSIQVDVLSGIGPFEYLWNTGDSTQNLHTALPGTYILSITDSLRCNYTFSFIVSYDSGINEAEKVDICKIYPNIVVENQTLRINCLNPAYSGTDIKIFDITGHLKNHLCKVHASKSEWSIQTDDLAPGIYFVTIGQYQGAFVKI